MSLGLGILGYGRGLGGNACVEDGHCCLGLPGVHAGCDGGCGCFLQDRGFFGVIVNASDDFNVA